MFDLLKHCKSTVSFITSFLSFVDELINKKKSVDPIFVIQKSAVEKPTNNPCNDLLIVMLLVKIQFSHPKPNCQTKFP